MRPPLQTIAPQFDDPIELLLACHEKVRRFARLAVRLRDHVSQAGPDAQAQDAAQSILRYFNMAAPLHHDDEEQDLFPALLTLNEPLLGAAIHALNDEHGALARRWQDLQPWLQSIASGQAHDAPESVDAFAQAYTLHAQREEDEVYPFASRLAPEQRRSLGAAMAARRTAK